MTENILERYIIQHFEAADGPDVFFSWHGGEPLIAGIDFFRKAVEIQKRHNHRNFTLKNGIQTNGTLLNDEWCRFFAEEDFYVGMSIDGPGELHDKYRITAGGVSSFDRVIEGYRKLTEYGIIPEILCVVNRENVIYPLEVYRFFKSLGVQFITFIPLVERDSIVSGKKDNGFSVGSEDFGKFLCTIFDEWVSEDIGKVKIQIIEEALRTAFDQDHTLCIFKKTCGGVPVVEMNGDFYCCDHYVDDRHRVGNIREKSLAEMLDSEKQTSFGVDKKKNLPQYCIECEVLSMCNGECPKNRFILTPEGEPGLNWLCGGYKMFFRHIAPFTAAVSAEWRKNQ